MQQLHGEITAWDVPNYKEALDTVIRGIHIGLNDEYKRGFNESVQPEKLQLIDYESNDGLVTLFAHEYNETIEAYDISRDPFSMKLFVLEN